MLGELDDFGGVAFLEKSFDRVDDLLDAAGVGVHRVVIDELADIDDAFDCPAELVEIDTG